MSALIADSLISSSQYEAGSAPALALEATKERTVARFANYAKSGVLCGNDGFPHLIADPGLALKFGHAGEIFVSDAGALEGWMSKQMFLAYGVRG